MTMAVSPKTTREFKRCVNMHPDKDKPRDQKGVVLDFPHQKKHPQRTDGFHSQSHRLQLQRTLDLAHQKTGIATKRLGRGLRERCSQTIDALIEDLSATSNHFLIVG
jgi:hypothetical protein